METQDSLRSFLEKISKLEPVEYKAHPADRVLIDYLSSKLRKDWRFSDQRLERLLRGELADWTHKDVSAHVLTCARCARRVARLKLPAFRILIQVHERIRELAQRMRRPPLRPLLQRRAVFYGHLAAYAVASLFIFLSIYQLPPFPSGEMLEAPGGVGLQPPQKEELRKDIERLREKAEPLAPERELLFQPRRPNFLWTIPLITLWGTIVLFHGIIAFKKKPA